MSSTDTLREPLVTPDDDEDNLREKEKEFQEEMVSRAMLLMKVELVLQPIMFLVGLVNLKGASGVIPSVVQTGTIVVSFLCVKTCVPRIFANVVMNFSLFLGRNGSVTGGGAVPPFVDTLRRAGLDRGLE